MKKILLKTLLVMVLVNGLSQLGNAQRVFVKVQPVIGAEARPPAPSPRHVWVDGEWAWRGGTYVRVPGYWVVPDPNKVWVPGHWRQAYGGWNWVPGHWRRR